MHGRFRAAFAPRHSGRGLFSVAPAGAVRTQMLGAP